MDPTKDEFTGHFPFASSRLQDTWALQDLTNISLNELGSGGQSSTGTNAEFAFVQVSLVSLV